MSVRLSVSRLRRENISSHFSSCDIPQFISRIVSETIAMEDQYELVYALYRMLSSPMTLDDLYIHHCNIELVNALLTHVVSLFVLDVYVFIRAV